MVILGKALTFGAPFLRFNLSSYVNMQILFGCRLVDIAPHYFDLENFPQCEAKRVLERLYKKRDKEREESRNRK